MLLHNQKCRSKDNPRKCRMEHTPEMSQGEIIPKRVAGKIIPKHVAGKIIQRNAAGKINPETVAGKIIPLTYCAYNAASQGGTLRKCGILILWKFWRVCSLKIVRPVHAGHRARSIYT